MFQAFLNSSYDIFTDVSLPVLRSSGESGRGVGVGASRPGAFHFFSLAVTF